MARFEREHRSRRPGRGAATVLAVLATAALAACGGEQDAEASRAAVVPEQPAAGTEPRVFFQEPADGATVGSSVTAVFGSENVEIAAVPTEVESPRPGVVHYHLGFDTECLPPGTVIPKSDPWIHFGDGSNRIDVDFPGPGVYRLSVQAGDDEHRTIEGLCETIEVTSEGAP